MQNKTIIERLTIHFINCTIKILFTKHQKVSEATI